MHYFAGYSGQSSRVYKEFDTISREIRCAVICRGKPGSNENDLLTLKHDRSLRCAFWLADVCSLAVGDRHMLRIPHLAVVCGNACSFANRFTGWHCPAPR